MKRLLIVYHSMTGAAEQLARAAFDGARTEAGIAVRLQKARDTVADDLLVADGYLFATPENLASMAGMMKDFFDRTYYGALDRIQGRPYALIIAAGTDGTNAARQVERIATGWRLQRVAPTMIVVNGAQTPEQILAPKIVPPEELARAAELGAALAVGLVSGIF